MNGPALIREEHDGVRWWTDSALHEETGVLVCFSERAGGAGAPPYESLNLAGHVGDDPTIVDANRDRLLDALGIGRYRSALTLAQQVHGSLVTRVGTGDAGAGASAAGGPSPLPDSDALVTSLPNVPLLLCFADCVPVVLVSGGRSVAVVHAGWRGALAGIPGRAVLAMTEAGEALEDVRAYIGAHIGPCHYEVGRDVMSQFANAFGKVAQAESGGLDLGAVVTASLTHAGVDPCNIARLGICTAEATDRFFSHRAEGGLTGRHGALVCIL